MSKKIIFITGTDTGVGKTVVCAALALAFKNKGMDVGISKPIATGAIRKNKCLMSEDMEFLRKITNIKDPLSLVNPYCTDLPLAPNLAFKLRNKIVSISKILDSIKELNKKHDLLLVEGIGGISVPIKDDYLVIDLIKDLDASLIIVSRNGLGTINHTLLTIKEARDRGIDILGVVFNNKGSNKDISKKTNPEIIRKLGKVDILGYLPKINFNKVNDFRKLSSKSINIKLILSKINKKSGNEYERLAMLDKKYIWHPFTQMKDWLKEDPLIIKEARGSFLRDVNGNDFIDGVSSLWVNVHGHQKKEVDQGIKAQLNKVSHSTLLGLANVPAIELAERIVKLLPRSLSKVFYSDNGSTSVEVALKMAFQYWQHKGKKKKTKFVYLDNSYHGDTIGSVSVGGVDLFHRVFHPLLFRSFKIDSPFCYRCPKLKIYPSCKLACLEKLENTLKNHNNEIAALIVEPLVQAAGGMIVWQKGVLSRMRSLCNKYNVLLIADEVAVGFGRTGKMFACEHEKVTPDIICLSKGLTAGYLPLAMTVAKEDIYNAFLADYKDMKTFFHGHSYTGNPLACAAALASLDVFKKEKTVANLQLKVRFLQKELKYYNKLEHVGDVRQKGLIVGIELVKNKDSKEPYPWQDKMGIKVTQNLRKRGIILRPLGNCIVIMPPLSISTQELKYLLDQTYEAIKKITER